MPIKINDTFMSLEIDGTVIATARERDDGWWDVSYWPRFFNRNQAITALTVIELLLAGRDGNDPTVTALQGELWFPQSGHAWHLITSNLSNGLAPMCPKCALVSAIIAQ